jgi:hypothetical protein
MNSTDKTADSVKRLERRQEKRGANRKDRNTRRKSGASLEKDRDAVCKERNASRKEPTPGRKDRDATRKRGRRFERPEFDRPRIRSRHEGAFAPDDAIIQPSALARTQ